MSRIIRHGVGEIRYSAGVDRGVFYPPLGPGIPWSGLVSVDEKVDESEIMVTYMDGQKIETQVKFGTFVATIQAVTYPLEFEEYDGYADGYTSQERKPFNFAYRTMLANEQVGVNLGYQIHLVYNALASPTDRDYKSLDGKSSPMLFAWDVATLPVIGPGVRPSSHIIIDSTTAYPSVIQELEDILYGNDLTDPRFPTMDEVRDIFEQHSIFKVTDLGDGVALIEGPDGVVDMTGPDTARFTFKTVVQVSEDTYRLTSW